MQRQGYIKIFAMRNMKENPLKSWLLMFSISILIQLTTSTLTSNTSSPFIPINRTSCIEPSSSNNSTVIFLGNCKNIVYYANLSMGSNQQVMTFQVDTGFLISWIPLVEGNETGGFNFSSSTTVVITNTTAYQYYTNFSAVGGNLGTEYMQVPNGAAINSQIDMLFAFNESGTAIPPGVQGAVSLSYAGLNLFDLAYQNNTISTSTFALDLNPLNQTSLLYYNNGLPSAIAANTTWIPRYAPTKSNWWQAQIIGMQINNVQIETNMPTIAFFNSGSYSICFGPIMFASIVSQYFNFTFCFIQNGYPVCPCNLANSWPSFSFMLMGVQVYVDPSEYKKIFSQTGLCYASINQISSNEQMTLGIPFFSNYTVSFDKQHSRMGLYGRSKPVYIIDINNPRIGYFILLQYIMCGMMGGLGVIGLVICAVGYKRVVGYKGQVGQKWVLKREKLIDNQEGDSTFRQSKSQRPSNIEMVYNL